MELDILEIKKYMENSGDTIKETSLHFGVSSYKISQAIKKLKENNNWNEEKIKKAKRIKNKRENKYNYTTEDKEAYKKIIDYLSINYFNYNKDKRFNSIIAKFLNPLRKKYSSMVIWTAVSISKKQMNYAVQNKNFNNAYNKTSYLFAIIKSSIPNALKIIEKKKIEEKNQENKMKDNINIIDNDFIESHSTKRDLSEFLE